MRNIFVATIFILSAQTASADTKAADACKETLTPVGQQVYDASMAQKPTAATAKGIVTKEIKKMVFSGKLGMSDARTVGEAVGNCMKKLE
ncbi:MAG: hypothetical protein ACSHXD_04820 [Marinosulfonomonas sp.]